ncbi:hypothetical protein [Aeromicrobium sp. Root495]|uniref:hypothetical protein n=1 Tax=Aeromicrobium sp. Root495 TaxID=1736550 RepID=UPI000AF504D9|nr:hypothetical protein [Aeromicrobium sp. Root495]
MTAQTLDFIDLFVLRARRIGAHSMAKDRAALRQLGQFTMSGTIALDGTMEMTRSLPEEEVFESLAARVRPLLVKTESVHHGAVLDVIEDKLLSADLPSDDKSALTEDLATLREDWSRFDTDSDTVLGFSMQSSLLDGTEATPQVSDTQLASAWLYGDVVHVDLRGKKTDGQLFPVKERFAAAVMYFSLVADLALTTLDYLKVLDKLGALALSPQALDEPVVVAASELVDTASAFIADVGTPAPDLSVSAGDAPEGFKQLTVVDVLRMDPRNEVDFVLEDETGQQVASYAAAVSNRRQADGRLFWSALIENVLEIELSFSASGETLADGRLENVGAHTESNSTLLTEAELQQQLASSSRASFVVTGLPFATLGIPDVTEGAVAAREVELETLRDLVAIEKATQTNLSPLHGSYTNSARVELRVARLLWEGKIVRFTPGPLSAVAASRTIPEVVLRSERMFTVGQVEVPFPRVLLHHPDAHATSVTPTPESNPSTDDLVLVVPEGEVFVAWAPDLVTVQPGFEVSSASRWNLSHLDDANYEFGN